MAKRKESIQKIEIKKDRWDYVYMFLMLVFTFVLAFSGIFVIPGAIEDSEWQRIDYKELAGWVGATITNPNEILVQCELLPPESSKLLEETYATCPDGRIVHIIIKKDESEECFSKWEGSCG